MTQFGYLSSSFLEYVDKSEEKPQDDKIIPITTIKATKDFFIAQC